MKSNSGLLSTPNAFVAQGGSISKQALSFHFTVCSTPWIIDSGASDHMTSFSHLFHTYNPSSDHEKNCIVDGSYSSIDNKGLINLCKNISLNNGAHVPKLTCNLLSVSKLSKDSNCRVIFSKSYCIFHEQNSGKMIGSAKLIDDLYIFEDEEFKNKEAQGFSSISTQVKDQIKLWHYRLGHPSSLS